MNGTVVIPPGFSAGGPADQRAVGLGAAGGAYLDAGLLERLSDAGVTIGSVVRLDQRWADDAASYADPIEELAAHGALIADGVAGVVHSGAAPIIAGGSCVALPGVLGGLQRALDPTARIGLVWFDAHGDFNTPRTSQTGMLGGMPVAVSAGLCLPDWRIGAGQAIPIPTDRIMMVDVRNLDPEERTLVQATDVAIAPVPGAPGGEPGEAFSDALQRLAERVDHLYLHIDADVLDARFQPGHPTIEPNGPDLEQTLEAIEAVFATGKARAFSVVSVNTTGPEGATARDSALALILGGVSAWVRAVGAVE